MPVTAKTTCSVAVVQKPVRMLGQSCSTGSNQHSLTMLRDAKSENALSIVFSVCSYFIHSFIHSYPLAALAHCAATLAASVRVRQDPAGIRKSGERAWRRAHARETRGRAAPVFSRVARVVTFGGRRDVWWAQSYAQTVTISSLLAHLLPL